MSVEALKVDLIKRIIEVEDTALLQELQTVLGRSDEDRQPTTSAEDWLQLAKQPTPKTLDVEQLAKEQGYDPAKLRAVLENWNYAIWEILTICKLPLCNCIQWT